MKRVLLLLPLVLCIAIPVAKSSTPVPVIIYYPDRHVVVFYSGEEVIFDESSSFAAPGTSITRYDWFINLVGQMLTPLFTLSRSPRGRPKNNTSCA